MQIVKDLTGFSADGQTALTIGKFDGLHRGHQLLISQTVKAAKERGYIPAAFVINMAPVRLLSTREREMLMEDLGIELLIEADLTSSFIRTTAGEFLENTLVKALHCKYLVVGEDFRFGYQRQGDVELLKVRGAELGLDTMAVPKLNDGAGRISSSRVRECLKACRIREANDLLGYPYFITGEIIHGRQIGRTLGVPTANLIADQSKFMPPYGVYYTSCCATSAATGGLVKYNGVTNIGTKPTVDGHFVGVETYFFDCDEDLYGEDLKVSLLHFARPERKFDSLEDLRQQINADEKGAREFFASLPRPLSNCS